MASRLNLQKEFCEILGSNNVYFQPPQSLRMLYPCVRYSPSIPNQIHADNRYYAGMKQYEGVIIDSDPESEIPEKLLTTLPMVSLGKPYTSDNLNHFPFTIYY